MAENSLDTNQWLVVGLGNPGPDYASNRHNVGQMVLAELADRISATFKQPQGELAWSPRGGPASRVRG